MHRTAPQYSPSSSPIGTCLPQSLAPPVRPSNCATLHRTGRADSITPYMHRATDHIGDMIRQVGNLVPHCGESVEHAHVARTSDGKCCNHLPEGKVRQTKRGEVTLSKGAGRSMMLNEKARATSAATAYQQPSRRVGEVKDKQLVLNTSKSD